MRRTPAYRHWAETNFFGFYNAEAKLNIGVYALFRTNLGIVSSTVCMNSGSPAPHGKPISATCAPPCPSQPARPPRFQAGQLAVDPLPEAKHGLAHRL